MRENSGWRRPSARRGKAAVVAVALAAVVMPLSGCCSLAAYFCGPDRSRWVSRDYATPAAALASFLEAIRRDQPVYICESLSETAKARYGLTGVLECSIAWKRMRDENPGIHLAGDAVPGQAEIGSDGRWRYDLEVAGRRFVVWLRPQPYWSIRFADVDGEPQRAGSYVDAAAFRRMLAVESDLETTIDVRIQDPLLPELEPARVREVSIGHDWKVDELGGFDPS